MSDVHEQALANLVNQFARPLDFLRELAQNSIDAGSPRIEVWVDYLPPRDGHEGVLRIGVDDFGEGMDEAIIDGKLSRLFESTKDDDLTKIGKFGIGFTSIFAIQPDAVVLLTGRHGTYWKLHFRADRSFDKLVYDEPVSGTKITLFKQLAPDAVDTFVRDAKANLTYWCEHSDTPITFDDRTAGGAAVDAAAEAADPFAAFDDEAVGGAEAINRPLDVPGELWHHHTAPGTEVVIGYGPDPRYGYYNGGLTLLNTPNRDALGDYEGRLGHLTFKVKNDRLEHTLTRDNVLQDDHWNAAMRVVIEAHDALREQLVDRIEAATEAGEPLGALHALLAHECRTDDGQELARSFVGRNLFRDVYGRAKSLGLVRVQESKVGAVVLGKGQTALHDALSALGLSVLDDHPATRELLAATEEPPLFDFDFMRKRRSVLSADELFVLPSVIDDAVLPVAERKLVERTRELMAASVGMRLRLPATDRVLRFAPSHDSLLNRVELVVGDFGGMALGQADVLALNGSPDKTVFARPGPAWFRLPAFLSWRCLLVNRHHGLFRAQVLAANEDLELAAFGLAQALFAAEGLEGDATYHRLIEQLEAPA